MSHTYLVFDPLYSRRTNVAKYFEKYWKRINKCFVKSVLVILENLSDVEKPCTKIIVFSNVVAGIVTFHTKRCPDCYLGATAHHMPDVIVKALVSIWWSSTEWWTRLGFRYRVIIWHILEGVAKIWWKWWWWKINCIVEKRRGGVTEFGVIYTPVVRFCAINSYLAESNFQSETVQDVSA